ncbi:MAG: glycosyltransferase family 2 protein [Ferruginibacter sp.]
MDLSIIIVNYNVKYFLEQCLCSVMKACENIKAEIFVVDNHSTDGSREYLESKFKSVIFKWNNENIGFAKANNSVLKEVKGAQVLFLNPDTIVPEDCFEKCIAFFKMRETCGALGVRMIDGSGNFLRESKRSLPSVAASFYKMTGLARLFPASKKFSKYYAGHLPEHETNEIDVLAGAFFMINKKVLDKVEGFDESFFMYGEDIDLSYSILKTGFKNYYFPQTTIIHFKGESTQKQTGEYISRFYGAMQLFVKKHYKSNRGVFLIKPAIDFSKALAYVGFGLKKLIPVSKKMTAAERETFIIAGQAYFNEMIQLVKYADDPLIIHGRVTLDNRDKDPGIGSIDNIKTIITKYKTAKIIFCEDPLSFKRMIELMEELKDEVDFLFHAKKSDSIVGSSNKNQKGVFIAKP